MVGVNVSLLLINITWIGNLARTVLIALIDGKKPIQLYLALSGSKWDLKRTWQKEGHLVFRSLAYLPAFELMSLIDTAADSLVNCRTRVSKLSVWTSNDLWALWKTHSLYETMEAMCLVDWINTGCHPLSDERQRPWIPNLYCLGTHSQGLISQLSGVIPLLLLF